MNQSQQLISSKSTLMLTHMMMSVMTHMMPHMVTHWSCMMDMMMFMPMVMLLASVSTVMFWIPHSYTSFTKRSVYTMSNPFFALDLVPQVNSPFKNRKGNNPSLAGAISSSLILVNGLFKNLLIETYIY